MTRFLSAIPEPHLPKSQMIMQNSRLPIWVIYDRPDDYPNHYLVRKFYGNMPTDEMYGAQDLEELRAMLTRAGLVRFPRDATDDPKIVETWM